VGSGRPGAEGDRIGELVVLYGPNSAVGHRVGRRSHEDQRRGCLFDGSFSAPDDALNL
jgi:hypothetical protein